MTAARPDVSFRSILRQIQGEAGIPLGGCKYLQVDVPIDRAAARRLVPFGLWLTDPPRATLTAATYDTFPLGGPFCESALNIHVNSAVGRGLLSTWIVVDDDRSLVSGRELMGYPKKMADFQIEHRQDHVSASVSRFGKRVFSMEADRLQPEPDPPPVVGVRHFNVGGPGQLLLFMPIWTYNPRETIHASYQMKVSLEVFDSELDPLAQIISGDPIGGRLSMLDSSGLKYFFPIGYTGGPRWFANSFALRYR